MTKMQQTLEVKDFLELFRERDFASLDRFLNGLQSSFERGETSEKTLADTFYRFQSEELGATAEALLDDWVTYNPDSYAALLSRGTYLVAEGFRKRGADYAEETKTKQWMGMHQYFEKAQNDLLVSLNLTAKPVLSHCLLMPIEMAGGGEGREERMEAYYQAAIAAYPQSFQARSERLLTLRPEWYARSMEPVLEFLKDPSHSILEPQQLKQLESHRYEIEGHWLEYFVKDEDAAYKAFDMATGIFPTVSNLCRKAQILCNQTRLEEAYEILGQAAKLEMRNPASRETYAQTVAIVAFEMFEVMRKYPEAISMTEEAVKLWPTNPSITYQLAYMLYRINYRDPKIKPLLRQAAQSDRVKERAEQLLGDIEALEKSWFLQFLYVYGKWAQRFSSK